jgi:hypothetical protein
MMIGGIALLPHGHQSGKVSALFSCSLPSLALALVPALQLTLTLLLKVMIDELYIPSSRTGRRTSIGWL